MGEIGILSECEIDFLPPPNTLNTGIYKFVFSYIHVIIIMHAVCMAHSIVAGGIIIVQLEKVLM